MLNIHLTGREDFPYPKGNINATFHSFFDKKLYMSHENSAICFDRLQNEIQEVSLDTPISNLQFSDYHNAALAFARDGIYKIEQSAEQIFEMDDQELLYGQIFDGGAKAIVVLESGVYLLDLDTDGNQNQLTHIEGISGEIKAISVRCDTQFIALATATELISIDVEKKAIHGQSKVEGITSLSWSPKKTWLAGCIGNTVNFYEKNTLFRESLQFDKQISAVSYSPLDGDVLAVVLEDGCVYICTTKNRRWYKKWLIPSEGCIPTIFWDTESTSFDLAVAHNKGYSLYYFNNTTDSDGEDIYVINENVLHISHWSKSLIPPPLSHEHIDFNSQITCLACDETNTNNLAIFTLSTVFLPRQNAKYELPSVPVQTATFRDNVLYFATNTTIYQLKGNSIETVESGDDFVSFLTPNYTVYNNSKIVNLEGKVLRTENRRIVSFTDNQDSLVYLFNDGELVKDNKTVEHDVYSYLATGELLTYVHHFQRLAIQFGDNKTEREVERQAVVLFFCKKLFSIIIQMQRGNTETQAPHVIVEAHMRELIKNKQYQDALFISKRYQIPFTRIIRLGQISIPDLLEQIPDSKLRPFISVLNPIYKPDQQQNAKQNDSEEQKEIQAKKEQQAREMEEQCNANRGFIMSLLSYIFDTQIPYKDGLPSLPEEWGPNSNRATQFYSVACICFVLLDNPVAAIQFACRIPDPAVSKAALEFLLTIFDGDRLFDYSLKTYDLRCIKTVGHITMREPSSYIPMVEDLAKKDKTLMMAECDEQVGDYQSAIKHYAECGPDFYQHCKDIALAEEQYDTALRYLPQESAQFHDVLLAKVETLNKAKKYDELARLVAISRDRELILQYLDKIVIAGLLDIVQSQLQEEDKELVLKAIVSTGRTMQAAQYAETVLQSREQAANLYLECHEWGRAINCGKSVEEVADVAFKYHLKRAEDCKKEAEKLRVKFETIKMKQKEHVDSNKRSGKKKDERGLPAIVQKFKEMEPTQKYEELQNLTETLLDMCRREDDKNTLRNAYTSYVRALYPFPNLPEGEQQRPPVYLRKHLGYN